MADIRWKQCEAPSANFVTRMDTIALYDREPGPVSITVYFAPENLTHYMVHNHDNGLQMWFKSDGYTVSVIGTGR